MATPQVRSSERILQKALELFASRGYDATSVREICEAAGIAKPTLYHFYGSKEGVYRSLVEGAFEDFRLQVSRELKGPGPAPERLKRVARRYFEFARSHRELMRFIVSLVHNPSSGAPSADLPRLYEGIVALVAEAVEQGVARGELRPGALEPRMLVLMGALGEALCGNLIAGRPELTPALADSLVDTILEGMTPNRTP